MPSRDSIDRGEITYIRLIINHFYYVVTIGDSALPMLPPVVISQPG